MQEKETPPQKEFRSDRAFTQIIRALKQETSMYLHKQNLILLIIIPRLHRILLASCSVDYAADLTQYYKSSLRI